MYLFRVVQRASLPWKRHQGPQAPDGASGRAGEDASALHRFRPSAHAEQRGERKSTCRPQPQRLGHEPGVASTSVGHRPIGQPRLNGCAKHPQGGNREAQVEPSVSRQPHHLLATLEKSTGMKSVKQVQLD